MSEKEQTVTPQVLEAPPAEGNGNGYVSAADLLAAREKDVQVGARRYRIRALNYEQVVELRGQMIDVTQMAIPKNAAKGDRKIDPKTLSALRRIIAAGTIAPVLGLDPTKGATPDDLRFSDFFALGTAIMELAGARLSTGERVLP